MYLKNFVGLFLFSVLTIAFVFALQAHARADRLKNKLYGSTLISMRACGGTIC